MASDRSIVRWATASGVVLLPLLMAGACAPAEDVAANPAADAAVREELARRMTEFGEVARRGDADALMDFWTSDARLVEPGMDLDRAGFEAFARDFFATGRVLDLEMRTADVFAHGEVAYEFGEYDEVIQTGDQEPTTIRNYYAARWERGEDGLWRIDRFLAGPREAPEEM